MTTLRVLLIALPCAACLGIEACALALGGLCVRVGKGLSRAEFALWEWATGEKRPRRA